MKYIVWKVTDKNFTEVAHFEDAGLAQSFVEFANSTARIGTRYEITLKGTTPVW